MQKMQRQGVGTQGTDKAGHLPSHFYGKPSPDGTARIRPQAVSIVKRNNADEISKLVITGKSLPNIEQDGKRIFKMGPMSQEVGKKLQACFRKCHDELKKPANTSLKNNYLPSLNCISGFSTRVEDCKVEGNTNLEKGSLVLPTESKACSPVWKKCSECSAQDDDVETFKTVSNSENKNRNKVCDSRRKLYNIEGKTTNLNRYKSRYPESQMEKSKVGVQDNKQKFSRTERKSDHVVSEKDKDSNKRCRELEPKLGKTPKDNRLIQCSVCKRSFFKTRGPCHEKICRKDSERRQREPFRLNNEVYSGDIDLPFHGRRRGSTWKNQHEYFQANFTKGEKGTPKMSLSSTLHYGFDQSSFELEYRKLKKCNYCGRKMKSEYIKNHENNCKAFKSGKSQREPFRTASIPEVPSYISNNNIKSVSKIKDLIRFC